MNPFDQIDKNQFDWEKNPPFLHDSRIFPMIIRMHLYIAGADVDLITFALQAMVVRLFAVMLALAKLDGTVVGR